MNKIDGYFRRSMSEGQHLSAEKHFVEGGFPRHWHSCFEIEIILSGAGKYIVNDVEYEIAPNTVFFLTSTDFHYLQLTEDTELVNVSFDNELLDDKELTYFTLGKIAKANVFEDDEFERLVACAQILIHEYESSGDCQKLMLWYILKCLLRKKRAFGEEQKNSENNRGIKKAIIYMETHFAEKMTLQSVAAEAGYQAAYFSELFARVTGETYTAALKRLRLSRAKSMLAGGFTVSDACFLSGFGSLSNFLEAFKNDTGMTPTEYRIKASKSI